MVTIEELQKELDEFKEKYNGLIQTLSELGIKKVVDFSEYEIETYEDQEIETTTEEENEDLIP